MSSLRRHEGYLLIDSRNTPGLTEEIVKGIDADLPAHAGRGMFEAPTYTCSHCCAVVVLNPRRTRERAYCSGCDHYLCDACGAAKAMTGCKTFRQIIEETQEQAAKQAGGLILT